VNFSVYESSLRVDRDRKVALLELRIDTEIGSIMDYFSIFLERMQMCKRAADKLGLRFELSINDRDFI
jgi:hypothetical protein